MQNLLIAARATLVTLGLTGLAYPAVTTLAAQLLFPVSANGSLVTDTEGHRVGSELLGQSFSSSAYFQPRPSAAGDKGYDALASGGSNLGPTSQKLRDRMSADIERLRRENPGAPAMVPLDLVTASGSGLDPDITPAAAAWQIARVASARNVSEERIRSLVSDETEGRQLLVLGEPRVNVLLLNVLLDQEFGKPTPTP